MENSGSPYYPILGSGLMIGILIQKKSVVSSFNERFSRELTPFRTKKK